MPLMAFLDPTCTSSFIVKASSSSRYCWNKSNQQFLFIMLLRPNSKWFLESVGLEGLNKMLAGFSDKGAAAFCNIAYATGPDDEPILFEGRVEVTYHVSPRSILNWT